MCAAVLSSDIWKNADTVAGYVPLRREADVTMLLRECLRQGKQLLLPRVETDGVMTMRRIRNLAELVPGAYGIPEPTGTSPVV